LFLNRKRQSVTDSFYKLKLCFCLLLIIQLIFFEHSFSVISCYFYRIERTKYLSKYIHISFKNYINSILGLFHEKKERGERERERERERETHLESLKSKSPVLVTNPRHFVPRLLCSLLTSTTLMIDGKVTSIRYFCFR